MLGLEKWKDVNEELISFLLIL